MVASRAFAIGAGIYLLLAGTLSTTEVVTAPVLGGVAALAALRLAEVSDIRFSFSFRHLLIWFRSISGLLGATARVGVALVVAFRHAGTAAQADVVTFRHGSDPDPRERARRATAVLAASLAPDSFVVHLRPEEDRVLLHSVTKVRSASDPEWLA